MSDPHAEMEQRERNRAAKIAEEDTKKELLASLTDLRQVATGVVRDEGPANPMTMYRLAASLSVLAREAKQQAETNAANAAQLSQDNLKLQGQILEHTQTAGRLAWALVVLTFGLLVFTAYLCYDAYLKSKGDEKTHHYEAKPAESQSPVHPVTTPP